MPVVIFPHHFFEIMDDVLDFSKFLDKFLMMTATL